MTFAATVPELAFWRFVQGLLLPPIFTVTLAYIGDEWPAAEVAPRRRHLCLGLDHRRFFRPFHPGRSHRFHRLAAGDSASSPRSRS